MGIYVGLGEESKEISEIYLGAGESVKEVTEGYISDTDGNVKEIYSSVEPGQQVFTTSGTFTVPKGVKKVDIFLVGGGGKGGTTYRWDFTKWGDPSVDNYLKCGGSGGGGGYTKTVKGISVTPGKSYPIVVGAGSSSWKWDTNYNGGVSSGLYQEVSGGENGGFHGYYKNGSGSRSKGGSGGGSGSCNEEYWVSSEGTRNYYKYPYAGNGGSDGSNGYKYSKSGEVSYWGAAGQGTTTRTFGESTGTLYAGGGGGASAEYTNENYQGFGGDGGGGRGLINFSPGTNGTGGGGGAHSELYGSSSVRRVMYDQNSRYTEAIWACDTPGADGGSGVVIIRWGY